MRQTLTIARCALLSVALLLAWGCSRTPAAHTAPAASAQRPTAKAAAPSPAAAKADPVVAQRSEFIATGKPAPPCRDCDKNDGGSHPQFHGAPQMKLDSKTLADAQSTVDATCDLLDAGVKILEAHVKKPEKAEAALKSYQKKHKAHIADVLHRADEVRGRLKAAGYDQDIPAEIRPAFEKRMGAIQKRLETMRATYSQHPAVLEAFGAFFPRRR